MKNVYTLSVSAYYIGGVPITISENYFTLSRIYIVYIVDKHGVSCVGNEYKTR